MNPNKERQAIAFEQIAWGEDDAATTQLQADKVDAEMSSAVDCVLHGPPREHWEWAGCAPLSAWLA